MSRRVRGLKQETVIQNYKRSAFVRTSADEEGLRMFFSPHPIPDGLTAVQIRTCIMLYPLRKMQQRRRKDPMRPRGLPGQLIVFRGNKMTEENFNSGILRFLKAAAEDTLYGAPIK